SPSPDRTSELTRVSVVYDTSRASVAGVARHHRGVLRATLRGLAERKLRFALCVAAIVLGCALAGGTAVLGATVDRAFDRLFAERNAGVDVLVRAAPAFAGQQGGFVSRGQVPVDAVDVVDAVPGVGAAAGTRFGLAQLIDKQGQPIKSEGPP